MDESFRYAISQIADLTKQLMTLASGLIGLTVTFSKDMVKNANTSALRALKRGWLFMFLSLVAGIWTLMALSGSSASIKNLLQNNSIGYNARIPSLIQIILFLCGAYSFTRFGYGVAIKLPISESPRVTGLSLPSEDLKASIQEQDMEGECSLPAKQSSSIDTISQD